MSITCTNIQTYMELKNLFVRDGYKVTCEATDRNKKTMWLETETDCVVIECEGK